jgi:hypothetical protein
MKTQIPEHYLRSVGHIESLDLDGMRVWLSDELREVNHFFIGRDSEDLPVQAILNHVPYLSERARGFLQATIEGLVVDWTKSPAIEKPSAVRFLLDLAAEIPVKRTKESLQKMVVVNHGFESIPVDLQAPALRTIATLSDESDVLFWVNVSGRHPKFAGMAFQVLLKISVPDALKLLLGLIPDKSVAGSVVRGLLGELQSRKYKVT